MEPRAEIVDMDTLNTAAQGLTSADKGVLGIVAFCALVLVVATIKWLVNKLDAKEKAFEALQLRHEAQLENMYTTHKREVAEMNIRFIADLKEVREQTLKVVSNNNDALTEMKNTLNHSFEKLGARIHDLEEGRK